jgi:hypothetical protein
LCEVNNIVTLDQKLDYYMLLRQNALETAPEIRVESIKIYKLSRSAQYKELEGIRKV